MQNKVAILLMVVSKIEHIAYFTDGQQNKVQAILLLILKKRVD